METFIALRNRNMYIWISTFDTRAKHCIELNWTELNGVTLNWKQKETEIENETRVWKCEFSTQRQHKQHYISKTKWVNKYKLSWFNIKFKKNDGDVPLITAKYWYRTLCITNIVSLSLIIFWDRQLACANNFNYTSWYGRLLFTLTHTLTCAQPLQSRVHNRRTMIYLYVLYLYLENSMH